MNNVIHKTICGNQYLFSRVERTPNFSKAGSSKSVDFSDYQLAGVIHTKRENQSWHRLTPWSATGGKGNQEKKVNPSIRGISVIGNVHPGKMTAVDFHQRPGALYHGSREEFQFNVDYFTNGFHSEEDQEGSMTLGTGFYTTPFAEEAIKYSRFRRRGIDDALSFITALRPHQAVMLDLRQSENKKRNGPFPFDLAARWLQRYTDSLKMKPQNQLDVFEKEYFYLLATLLTQSTEPDLRELLDTVHYPYAIAGDLFTQMMVELGFDGIIYNENGDDKNTFRPNSPSYIFYNLNVLNTHEGWLERTQTP